MTTASDSSQARRGALASPSTAAELYRRQFQADPAGVWSAPGRVNLMGEHTDYNGGLVLPFAIAARAFVAVGAGSSSGFRVTSAQQNDALETADATELGPSSAAAAGWHSYVFGVLWALEQEGYSIPPLDIAIDSAVPVSAGLASSAAIECAVALAVSDLLRLDLEPVILAQIAQRAENHFVGAPCGLMDQLASMVCVPGHALLYDAGAHRAEHIPFDPSASGLQALVINARTRHGRTEGEYTQRRHECETAARALGVPHLSELTLVDITDRPAMIGGAAAMRRVQHVLSENARVRRVAQLLQADRTPDIGPELSASHASLRDDFEVSSIELDLAAAAAESAGALGARMIGTGFGSSVLALVPITAVYRTQDAVTTAFVEAGYREPAVFPVTPSAGAGRDA